MVHSDARAVGVMDLPSSLYAYSTPMLEDIVLKMQGVKSAKINNISHKVTVEFDPTVTSFERIKTMIKQAA
jgi:Heavy-metal-associated domain